MLASKWSGLKLQLEGTIDHLVSSVKMKDDVQLLSSTTGENMNETSVTWPTGKKEKLWKKALNDKWHIILSHFWPQPRLLNHSHKYFPLRAVRSSREFPPFNGQAAVWSIPGDGDMRRFVRSLLSWCFGTTGFISTQLSGTYLVDSSS